MSHYLHLHSHNRKIALARGWGVFDRWKTEGRQVEMSHRLFPQFWTWPEKAEPPLFIYVDTPGVEAWVRFVEEMALTPDVVVLVDIHHPIWRSDLQTFPDGNPGAGKTLWNHPATIGMIQRAMQAADAVVTSSYIWGDSYHQLPELLEYNRHVHEIEDIEDEDDTGRFEVELEMAFVEALRRGKTRR